MNEKLKGARPAGRVKEGLGSTLCKDLPEVNYSGTVRIKKKAGEKGLGAFNRWIRDQADGWCEAGLCSKGTCRGSLRNPQAELISETDEEVEVKFSTTIFCECR